MNSRIVTPESNALAQICREWYISLGCITSAVLLSLWIRPMWMPVYELLLAMTLAIYGPGRRTGSSNPCGRISIITIYTLVITGITSLSISVAYRTNIIYHFFEETALNHSIPYITALIIFPVCMALCLILNSGFVYRLHVRGCHLHNQYCPELPMFGRFIHATYRSLLKKLTLICLSVSILDWAYYFVYYENANINKPDRFFFFIVPAVIYIASIIYVRHHYSSLTILGGQTVNASTDNASANIQPVRKSNILRFLVVKDKTLLLNMNETTIMNGSIDTPIVEIEPLSEKIDIEVARSIFEDKTGIREFKIKELYFKKNKTLDNCTFHYLVTLKEDARTDTLYGAWITLPDIDRLMKMGVVAPNFADEIFRIYTISIASRTYYRDGRRRYPIRNYRPTFRLEDLHKRDTDYSDDHWLRIARVNEDAPLWFLRKWRIKSKH